MILDTGLKELKILVFDFSCYLLRLLTHACITKNRATDKPQMSLRYFQNMPFYTLPGNIIKYNRKYLL